MCQAVTNVSAVEPIRIFYRQLNAERFTWLNTELEKQAPVFIGLCSCCKVTTHAAWAQAKEELSPHSGSWQGRTHNCVRRFVWHCLGWACATKSWDSHSQVASSIAWKHMASCPLWFCLP